MLQFSRLKGWIFKEGKKKFKDHTSKENNESNLDASKSRHRMMPLPKDFVEPMLYWQLYKTFPSPRKVPYAKLKRKHIDHHSRMTKLKKARCVCDSVQKKQSCGVQHSFLECNAHQPASSNCMNTKRSRHNMSWNVRALSSIMYVKGKGDGYTCGS